MRLDRGTCAVAFILTITVAAMAVASPLPAERPKPPAWPRGDGGHRWAPRKAVWEAFTTTDGVKRWMVAQADLQTKNGGVWKTKYSKDGVLGDEGTIVNEVLAHDPERMFVLRILTPPKGFPFMKSFRDMWTVVYFDDEEGERTRVTIRAHGFTEEEESRKLRAFFEGGNKQTLAALSAHFQKSKSRAR